MASLGGTADVSTAQGLTPYDLGGPQHNESVSERKPQRKGPEIADPWHASVIPEQQLKHGPVSARHVIPNAEQYMEGYHVLSNRLPGAYLQPRELKRAPHGFEEFCRELASFCEKLARPRNDIFHDFTPEFFSLIETINRGVNEEIKPKIDLEIHGVQEYWTIPKEFGDCEDYVLLKIKKLIEKGLNPVYLHILVVEDEKKEGHAVLGVDVFEKDGGRWSTVILDNKNPDIITLDEMEKNYKGELASFITPLHAGGLRVRFWQYSSAGEVLRNGRAPSLEH